MLLFIGSACADVVVRIPKIPKTGEDLHVTSQSVSLGGCACNAFFAARRTHLTECRLFAPVGSGVWADFVSSALEARGAASCAPRVAEPNGCCYCLVEDGGERTFLSEHGAEYRFRPEWNFDLEHAEGVYLCGLEIEEKTGSVLLDKLEQCPPEHLYFAPGPRITRIPWEKLNRLFAMHCVLHLNEDEACGYTKKASPEKAAEALRRLTGSDVYITLGARGVLVWSDDFRGIVPGEKAQVVDTIGAGDAHIGTLMACLAAGYPPKKAAAEANHASALVVAQPGAILD